MVALLQKILKYWKRLRLLADIRQIGVSVNSHRREYAILARETKKYLMRKGSALRRGGWKWRG